jgi:hypothetical protein
MLLLMAIIAPLANAQGSVDATITSDNLNVRRTPNGEVVGTLNSNTTVRVTAREDQQGNGGIWVLVSGGGVEGWVLSEFVQFPSGFVMESLPVSGAEAPAPQPQAQQETQEESQPASNNIPAPVTGGGGIGGFGFGAHVAHMGNADLMASIGMSWMKIQLRYNRGDNPDNYAGMINNAHALGFHLLLGVVGSPGDISAGGDSYFAEYATFVAGLARNGVDAVEVWNEPNLDREWPVGSVDPAQYTRLLAAAYNAIKSSNPNTVVISGAPAPTGFFGGCTPNGCDDAVYVAGMARAGAASYMDCVGAHYNEGIVAPTAQSGDPRSEFYTRYFFGMVNAYVNAIGKPVCFTELGYVTPDGYGPMPPGFEWGNNNTIEEHASWLAQAINLGAQNANVRLIIVWNLNYFSPPGSPDPAGGYSMIRPDGSCPACNAIAGR